MGYVRSLWNDDDPALEPHDETYRLHWAKYGLRQAVAAVRGARVAWGSDGGDRLIATGKGWGMRIRSMTAADLSVGMRLTSQASWNQVESDWRRFLSMQPDGCFLAEEEGVPVGTAVVNVFDAVAWLAMVLVDRAVRGRGIGTALIRHALTFADQLGVRGVRLDATPLGHPLYEKLGFSAEYSLARYGGTLPVFVTSPSPFIETAEPGDYGPILALDRDVTGADRQKFLLRLFQERPYSVYVVKSNEISGYMTVRAGSGAIQLGPCVAAGTGGGELIKHAARDLAGCQAFLDIPADSPAAVHLAQSLHLKPARSFVRMRRGEVQGDDIARLWASSGPELG